MICHHQHECSFECVFIHEWVCVYNMSAQCAWCIDILYLPNVSAFVLVLPACDTICCLFVSVPEIPEIPTIHHSCHHAVSNFIFSGCKGWMVSNKTTCSWPAELWACAGTSYYFHVFIYYLIVSSFPLRCWNLLWRFLICSSETEKKHTPTTWKYVNDTPIITPHPSTGLLHSFSCFSGMSNMQLTNDKQKITPTEMTASLLFLIFLYFVIHWTIVKWWDLVLLNWSLLSV